MAKKKQKKEKVAPLTMSQKLNDIQLADQYGVSPDFFRSNDKIIKDVKNVLQSKFEIDELPSGKKSETPIDPNIAYLEVLGRGMKRDDKVMFQQNINNQANTFSSQSGMYPIDDVNKEDESLIHDYVGHVNNHFQAMTEYWKIAGLIPEIKKSIEMIVGDILNVDELNHSFIQNFYTIKQGDENEKGTKIEKSIKSLLEEYNFETRLKKFLETAEITGVKPFSILPSDDIIDMVFKNDDKTQNTESVDKYIDELNHDVDAICLESSPLTKIREFKSQSTENADEFGMYETTIEEFTESIIDDEVIAEWEEVGLEFLDSEYKETLWNSYSEEGLDVNKLKTSYNSFQDSIKKFSKDDKKKKLSIKKQIQNLIVEIDKNIDIVDPKKTPLMQGIKRLKKSKIGGQKGSFNATSGTSSNLKEELQNDFYGRFANNPLDENNKKSKKKKGKGTVLDDISNIISGEFTDKSLTTGDAFLEHFKKNETTRRAIMTEYEPENVIPIVSGGTYIGFYVVEKGNESDGVFGMKKYSGSFADLIRSFGIGEDKQTMGTGNVSPTDNTSNPYNAGAFTPGTIISSMNFGSMGSSDRSSNAKKFNIMKKIMIRTIAKRLGNSDLAFDTTFQNSIFNLLKDEMIYKKNIQFSFIPASHMIYMTRDTDDNGLPLSILDGTLFRCYMYLSSVISNNLIKVMKSSNTETVEVNMGSSKELGLSISEISKHMSNRQLSAHTLFSGVSGVFKNVGQYQKNYIPIFNGERLYNITQAERTNDVDIDDEHTDKQLRSIILKMGIPPTSLDLIDNEEFVASLAQHRIDYRNVIIQRGFNYSDPVTKAIKLLVYYSDLYKDVSKESDKDKNDTTGDYIDLDNIDFNFKPPKTLMVNKLTEEISNSKDVVDSLIEVLIGEDDRESAEFPLFKEELRKNLVKKFINLEWSDIDEIVKASRQNAIIAHAQLEKDNIETSGSDTDDY